MIEWRARAGTSGGALSRPDLQLAEQLHRLTASLIACEDYSTAIDIMIDGAIDLNNADLGNLQFYRPETSTLEIVGQRGFTQSFLDEFRVVSADDPCACGRALRQNCAIVIEDVEQDPDYAPYRAVARAAGYRAVQSMPVVTGDGDFLAVLSTHFREPHIPSEIEMRVTDLFARQAAEILHRLHGEVMLQQEALRNDVIAKELSHRVKNVLTMVQAISRETMKGSAGLGQYAELFDGRMRALAHAHESLAKSQWQGTTVDQLLHEQLADFGSTRASWSGPIVRLTPNTAYVLALVLHELGVNARKHGALRSGAGRVTIEWDNNPTGDSLVIRWTESGGGQIAEPTEQGSGSALLRTLERTGFISVLRRYEPSGLVCELTLPLEPS